MIYIINKLFSRASSVLVTINSPIHQKVPKNGKHLAAACCSLLGKKKTSVGFLFAGSLENITQYLPHCNFFNPKKLPTTIESIVAFKLPETTTTPMKIGLIFQPFDVSGLSFRQCNFFDQKKPTNCKGESPKHHRSPLQFFNCFFTPKAPSKKAISVAKCSRCATRCWNAGVAPIQIPVDTWKTLAEIFVYLNPKGLEFFHISPLKTNMTTWKITIFNREIHLQIWLVLHCHARFPGWDIFRFSL